MTDPALISSPCIDICNVDVTGQYCIGCGRSLDEIAAWPTASCEEKLQILAKLPDRKALLA
ncbi:DUF1289 domain-containing protein [Sphingorhabdus sp.]|uniref:DUF1289 domain-containing protein n=1 Tax=Sphingorhabdus sp. TaxID=1902408 RepID=UPI003593F079